jgi:hypothetical protein
MLLLIYIYVVFSSTLFLKHLELYLYTLKFITYPYVAFLLFRDVWATSCSLYNNRIYPKHLSFFSIDTNLTGSLG